MARVSSKEPVVLAEGVSVDMTPRQAAFFEVLKSSEGKPVALEDMLSQLEVSIHNLRVTKSQVAALVAGQYKIISKWGQYYRLDPVAPVGE